jgi:HAD superfamily hydrolase (TIGR01509 family)
MSWHLSGDPEEFLGYPYAWGFEDIYEDDFTHHASPFYDGIEEMLRNLQGHHFDIKFGALSNGCTAYVDETFRANKVDDLFEQSLGADFVGVPKPHPHGLRKLCSIMDLNEEKCIFVGDAPSDAKAARSAGIVSIGVTWGNFREEVVAREFDHVAHSVEGLKQKIEELLLTL